MPWGSIGLMLLYLLVTGYLTPPRTAPDSVGINMVGFLLFFAMGMGYRLGANMNPFDFTIHKTENLISERKQD